jgi:hypothetical protein
MQVINPWDFPRGDKRRLWLPPGARDPRFEAVSFSKEQLSQLTRRFGLTSERLARLKVALRLIAFYTEAPRSLSEVRKPLTDILEHTCSAIRSLDALMSQPKHDAARDEAKLRYLESTAELHPEGCQPNSKISLFHQYDPREDEVARWRSLLVEFAEIAKHAIDQIPRGASKAPAHWYPIFYLDEALNHNAKEGERIPPSASRTSKFREIAAICYRAAKAPTADPETAIRKYLKQPWRKAPENK